MLAAAACAGALALSANAGFVNGGFESGDFTGWSQANGYWYGGTYYQNVAGNLNKSAVVGVGTDPLTLNNLHTVPYGNYAARVNNSDPNAHWSLISQTAVWTDPNIYFAWAAVLQEPSNFHGEDAAPHFRVILQDLTTGVQLYNQSYNVYNLPAGTFHDGATQWGETWKYCDWQVANLNTANVIGHQLQLSVLGSDCGWGGHGGYIYVDGFSATRPPDPNKVPDAGASAMLLGIGSLGLAALRRKIR